ncbi:hypothetical protein GJ496_003620 [Pomphorhynchus laevis]|nr:hypothetical protein GJ496_003620 [Pomphorhynchus laevis]
MSKVGFKELARGTLICIVSDAPLKQTPLPTIEIIINNRSVRGLLDTGCSHTIVRRDILTYDTTRRLVKRLLQSDCLFANYDVLICIDFIERIGGIPIKCLNATNVAKKPENVMIDKDFSAKFFKRSWEIRWNWTGSEPSLNNRVSQYSVCQGITNEFDNEIHSFNGSLKILTRTKYDVIGLRELNPFVSNHSAESQVCSNTITE